MRLGAMKGRTEHHSGRNGEDRAHMGWWRGSMRGKNRAPLGEAHQEQSSHWVVDWVKAMSWGRRV